MIGIEQDLIESAPFHVVLVKAEVESLRTCQMLAEVSSDHLRPTSAQGWSMIHSAGVDPTRVASLAEGCSKQLAATALAILYEDTSEWFSYAAFENGSRVHEYSFSYLDDEAPPPDAAERTLSNEDDLIFLANGFGPQVSDDQLMSEHEFVDRLLREQGAFLGWEAVSP